MANNNPLYAADTEVTRHRFESVAEVMGVTLRQAAQSPNIRERRDYSCAVFDGRGRLLAQAAHIPVHLGAMPYSVAAARSRFDGTWAIGDVVVLNDPYHGGSHLPDLTTVSPFFSRDRCEPVAFLATRAHHSDIGGGAPGSMTSAADLFGEGLVVPPVRLQRAGTPVEDVVTMITANSRTPEERNADLRAQLAAHLAGERRLAELVPDSASFELQADRLLSWSERLSRRVLADLPQGTFEFEDQIEDDGRGNGPFAITVAVTIDGHGGLSADFAGTASQAPGPVNAPHAVTASALRYVAACIFGGEVPLNAGAFAPLELHIPSGSLLNPIAPAPVAAGNVETSQRVVDVLLGALSLALPERIPAASQGTMNNVLLGGQLQDGQSWAYYETVGGGAGAWSGGPGASGRQVHMTNTRNTPAEALEIALPVRVIAYRLRRDSGGNGSQRGGDGVERRLMFQAPARVTLVSERRTTRPYGLSGGEAGAAGQNWLERTDGNRTRLPAKVQIDVAAGDTLAILTPGGGGWGLWNPLTSGVSPQPGLKSDVT